MRNDFHERLENRRHAHQELAAKRQREASARFDSNAIQTLRGMQGEPIKVGHHSEKRHRRLFERADNDMRAGSEALDKAKHHREKAATVGTGGVSQDDPDALAKVRGQLVEREARQTTWKRVNAWLRPLGLTIGDDWGPAAYAKLYEHLSEEEAAAVVKSLADAVRFEPGRLPLKFPAYKLTNNNAQIKRLRQRVAKLEQLPDADADPERLATGPDGYAETRPDLGRVAVEFRGKPAEEVRSLLKRHGFRWSSRQGAWLRHLNQAGRVAVQLVARELGWRAD